MGLAISAVGVVIYLGLVGGRIVTATVISAVLRGIKLI